MATCQLQVLVGMGTFLARVLDADVAGLTSFASIPGPRIRLPATPADLWIWLRGSDRGELQIRSRHLETLHAPAVGHSFDAFEALLARLSGAEDGQTDALFTFAEPETRAYFWYPLVLDGAIGL